MNNNYANYNKNEMKKSSYKEEIMQKKVMVVCVFGFLGAISRFLVYEALSYSLESYLITLLVNMCGSGLLGFINQFSFAYQKEILSGYLGSFTTFATFISDIFMIDPLQGLQGLQALEALNAYFFAFIYLVLSVVLGLLSFEFGDFLSVKIKETRKEKGQ